MTLLDIGLIVVFFYNGFQGFRKGFVKVVFEFISLGVGIGFGFRFYPVGVQLLSPYLPYQPDTLSWISFLVIFSLFYICLFVIGRAAETLLSVILLGPINRLMGCVLGCLKGFVLVSPLIFLFMTRDPVSLQDASFATFLLPYFQFFFDLFSLDTSPLDLASI